MVVVVVGWWVVVGGSGGEDSPLRPQDLLDETDRDKFQRLGTGEDPSPGPVFRVQSWREAAAAAAARSGAALRSHECGGESSLSARACLSAGLL